MNLTDTCFTLRMLNTIFPRYKRYDIFASSFSFTHHFNLYKSMLNPFAFGEKILYICIRIMEVACGRPFFVHKKCRYAVIMHFSMNIYAKKQGTCENQYGTSKNQFPTFFKNCRSCENLEPTSFSEMLKKYFFKAPFFSKR